MTTLPRTYRFLAGLQDSAADEALAAGARLLDGPYLRFAVEVVLQRAQPEGLEAVFDCYHRLPPDLKDSVIASATDVVPLIWTAVRSHELQTRLNTLEIASRIGSESLAYLFDMGLSDSNPKVRELAATMMRQTALRLLEEHPLLRQWPTSTSRQGATAQEEKRRRGEEETRSSGGVQGPGLGVRTAGAQAAAGGEGQDARRADTEAAATGEWESGAEASGTEDRGAAGAAARAPVRGAVVGGAALRFAPAQRGRRGVHVVRAVPGRAVLGDAG